MQCHTTEPVAFNDILLDGVVVHRSARSRPEQSDAGPEALCPVSVDDVLTDNVVKDTSHRWLQVAVDEGARVVSREGDTAVEHIVANHVIADQVGVGGAELVGQQDSARVGGDGVPRRLWNGPRPSGARLRRSRRVPRRRPGTGDKTVCRVASTGVVPVDPVSGDGHVGNRTDRGAGGEDALPHCALDGEAIDLNVGTLDGHPGQARRRNGGGPPSAKDRWSLWCRRPGSRPPGREVSAGGNDHVLGVGALADATVAPRGAAFNRRLDRRISGGGAGEAAVQWRTRR